jgi:ribosomal protein S18 acetylase RimI-like enzyme
MALTLPRICYTFDADLPMRCNTAPAGRIARMSTPSPDVSVRVAWSEDADAIAAVQVRAWREEYAGTLPVDVLSSLDPDDFAEAWRASLARPKDARNRVLVALERNTVRGFAVTSPCEDPDADPIVDGEVSEFTVDPDQTRHGHGSRLLQACADTMRADKFDRAVVWLNSTDDALRAFLSGAGWAPDGASRELDLDGDGTVRVKQVRLHTALTG